MNSKEVKAVFESSQRALGQHPCPKDAIEAMIKFYASKRVDDCILEDDGDMLLYQWGTYDWGNGNWFELNITRQLIPSVGDDDEIYQLSLTLHYPAKPELEALESGNEWCATPSDTIAYKAFIIESEPMLRLALVPCDHVTYEYINAG